MSSFWRKSWPSKGHLRPLKAHAFLSTFYILNLGWPPTTWPLAALRSLAKYTKMIFLQNHATLCDPNISTKKLKPLFTIFVWVGKRFLKTKKILRMRQLINYQTRSCQNTSFCFSMAISFGMRHIAIIMFADWKNTASFGWLDLDRSTSVETVSS
jgi:hypothetical protein